MSAVNTLRARAGVRRYQMKHRLAVTYSSRLSKAVETSGRMAGTLIVAVFHTI